MGHDLHEGAAALAGKRQHKMVSELVHGKLFPGEALALLLRASARRPVHKVMLLQALLHEVLELKQLLQGHAPGRHVRDGRAVGVALAVVRGRQPGRKGLARVHGFEGLARALLHRQALGEGRLGLKQRLPRARALGPALVRRALRREAREGPDAVLLHRLAGPVRRQGSDCRLHAPRLRGQPLVLWVPGDKVREGAQEPRLGGRHDRAEEALGLAVLGALRELL
mmetsp:Transcript_93891/g.303303  ORF Transcript_93891/g.303303 Transcript_93891/m.303303 type:complete len:225 (-) Transcript_93891:921-1595(-)